MNTNIVKILVDIGLAPVTPPGHAPMTPPADTAPPEEEETSFLWGVPHFGAS